MSLTQFLKSHKSSKNYTHLSLAPNGKYIIPADDLSELYRLIAAESSPPHILEGREGLTAGPLLIDLDFEYPDQTCELRHTSEHPVRLGERDTVNVKQSQGWLRDQTLRGCDIVATRKSDPNTARFHDRQYTPEHIERFIDLIHGALTYFFGREVTDGVEYVVSEKPAPTIEYGKRVKDGLHVLGKGLHMTYADQHRFRNYVLQKHFLQNAFEMEYVRNKPEDVYDKSVVEKNAWYLLGCSKPDRDPYMPTMSFFEEGGDLVVQQVDASMYSIADLSIRVGGEEVTCLPERAEEWRELVPTPTKRTQPATASVGEPSIAWSGAKLPEESVQLLLNSLLPTRADSYQDWVRCGMILKNEGYAFSLWDTWSRSSSKYNAEECSRVWNSFKTVGNPVGMGTLVLMLKEDNLDAWKQFLALRSIRNTENRPTEIVEDDVDLERNSTISKILQLDTTKWIVSQYEAGYKLVRNVNQCLVDPSEHHEQCDHSCLFVQRTHGTAFCYTHKSRNLGKVRAEKIWRILRPDDATIVTKQTGATRDWNDPELLAAYEVRKVEFEKKTFRVLNPPGYMVLVDDTWVHYSRQQLMDMNSGLFLDEEKKFPFIVMWLRDEYIRTYSKTGYFVDAAECPATIFNTFTGFAAESLLATYIPSTIDIILNHVKLLCNHNVEAYEFILDWLAILLQRPGFLNGICVIFKGKHGCGKDMFLSWFGTRVVGLHNYYKTARPHIDLFGAFNSSRKDIVFYHIEEGTDAVFKDVNLQQFKNYITDSYASIQLKQKNTTTGDSLVKNYNHFAISTNHVITCEANERRFFGVEASSETCKQPAYFNALAQAMDNPDIVASFYWMLKHRDVSGRNWSELPETEYMKEMRSASLPELFYFLSEFMETREDDAIVVKASDLYEAYRDWHHIHGTEKVKTSNAFGREMKTIKGIQKDLERDGTYYVIHKTEVQLAH